LARLEVDALAAAPSGERNLIGVRVLVVEDLDDTRTLIVRLLSDAGAEVHELAGLPDLDRQEFDTVIVVNPNNPDGRAIAREANSVVSLARRPVLFALARALAEAWPDDVSRGTLVARAFRGKEADESHRARLRVEVARLRERHREARIQDSAGVERRR